VALWHNLYTCFAIDGKVLILMTGFPSLHTHPAQIQRFYRFTPRLTDYFYRAELYPSSSVSGIYPMYKFVLLLAQVQNLFL